MNSKLPKLYEYNLGWGSFRFINREAVLKERKLFKPML